MGLYNVKHEQKTKSVLVIFNESDIESAEREIQGFGFGDILDVELRVKNLSPELISRVEAILEKLPRGISRSVIVDNETAKLKIKDLENLIDMEDRLEKNNDLLFLEEGGEYHTLSETINAEEQIEQFGAKIKAVDASPLEKYLMIYNFSTQKVYRENEVNKTDSRSVVSVLNGNNIVCVGYARLMRKLCLEVGIDCYIQDCAVVEDGEVEYHQNNLVRMKDEKYGVDGLFYADACWDSRKADCDDHKYSYCLIPLGDKDELSRVTIAMNDEDATCLCYTGEFSKVSRDMFLSDEGAEQIKQFGLDLKPTMATERVLGVDDVWDATEDFGGKERRLMAVDRLRMVLKKYEVPADFFSGKKLLPPELEVEYLLALLMEDDVDRDRFAAAISSLKLMLKPQNLWSGQNNSYGTYSDIYKELDEVEEVENNDGRKATIFIPVEERYAQIQNSRMVQKHLEGLMGDGKPIDYNSMCAAIKRSYILEGLSEADAEAATEAAVVRSKNYTAIAFWDSAQGAFMRELMDKKESASAEVAEGGEE